MIKSIPKAICGSPDRPLKIGNIEIPCYVLEDNKRVLTLTGMITSLDMKPGTSGRSSGSDRLTNFLTTKSLKPHVSNELMDVMGNPIKFRPPQGGRLAYGYEATILADICDAVLACRKARDLNPQQLHIASRCEILVRGFARIGIIALVDEATGFQAIRSRKALEEILEKFIAKELREWTKTFPDEFYEQIFKLRGWSYIPFSVKRPSVVGKYTTDLVYKRLAPGVLEELKKITPKDKKGRYKHRLFQRLTEDVGHPRLREHLSAVIALMKASSRWDKFYWMLNRALPKHQQTMPLPFPDNEEIPTHS